MDIHDLAIEIANALATQDKKDIAEIQDWLLTGGDDGSPVEVLADRFDMEVGVPSRRRPGDSRALPST